jgi:hypothetical protein
MQTNRGGPSWTQYIYTSRDRERGEKSTEQVRSTRRHLRSRITQDGFTFEGEKYELKRNKVGKSQSHHHHPSLGP